MLRIIAGPDGSAHVDGSGKLPGRGCYVYASSLCLRESVNRKRIARSLRVDGLDVQAETLLEEARLSSLRSLKNLLSMAQKAGRMVSGSETVSRSLSRGKLSFLILALGASEATANRVTGWSRGQGVSLYHLPFTVEELGQLLGKRPRAVAGVRFGELSKAIEEELIKANQLRDCAEPKRRCVFSS